MQAVEISGPIPILTFRVERFHCGIRTSRVREIVPMAATTKAPGQPSILEGFLNLRGWMLPVVRLGALFDLPFAAGPYTPVIVSEFRGSQLGLLVDGVEDVLAISDSDFRSVSGAHTVNECAEAEFTADGQEIILLDCERLFLAEENRRIGEMQGQIQRRLRTIEASRL